MSHIFRSDEVDIGQRVVVRRQFGSHYSDVIGHVIALNPLTIRPQEVGGYPSSLEAVEIPAEQIYIVKRLSPRTIRNSDIRQVETAYAKAFPGIEHTWTSDGQWLMRAGDGITERSNSATPLGHNAGFSPVPLEEITAFYKRHQLPVQLHIPERLGKSAERLLKDSNWELGPEILVMTRSLDEAIDVPPNQFSFKVADTPDQDWLGMYHFRGQDLPIDALRLLSKDIEGRLGFVSLLSPEGETVAITRATLTHSGDDTLWLGYSAVEVAPRWRRQGLGTLMGHHVMNWARQEGAHKAYLQVISSNEPGIGLYEKLGFIEHHRHRYAQLRG